MSQASGGQLLARALKAHGIGHVASLHGGHLDPFWDACIDEGIRLVDTRHEQAAVMLAEGWGWATGRTGVAAVTAGPGVANGLTGILNASVSGAPLVVLGGHVHSMLEGTRALQDMDVIPVVAQCSKSAATVRDAATIPYVVARAFATARDGRPGPAFLDFPAEQLSRRPRDVSAVHVLERMRAAGDPDAIDRVASTLRQATRPVVLAGSGVHWSGAAKQLQAFAEHTGIPVLTHAGGRGTLPDSHPLCLGSGSPVAGGAALVALTQADVIVVIGARFNFTLANGAPPLFSAAATIVRVDIDPREPTAGRPADIAVVGDAGVVLDQLRTALSPRADADWVQTLRQARASGLQQQRAEVDGAAGIHPLDLVLATNDVLGDTHGSITVDGGEIQVWGLQGAHVSGPGRFLSVGPLGTLGIGMPFAMAAKLARPDEPSVLISGDGAFGFNGIEIESAVRHGLPVVCVVSNDRSWGMSRHGQGLVYGYDRVVGTELSDSTRYDELARSLGAQGWLVTERADLRPTLEKALASGAPAILDVRVDRDVVSPTTRYMVGAGGGH